MIVVPVIYAVIILFIGLLLLRTDIEIKGLSDEVIGIIIFIARVIGVWCVVHPLWTIISQLILYK